MSALRETHTSKVRNIVWPTLGEIVLIHDEGPRAKWKLGKICELYQGEDGAIRVVQLKTSLGLINRPVVKLYPLELRSVEVEEPTKITVFNERPIRATAAEAAQVRKRLIEAGHL